MRTTLDLDDDVLAIAEEIARRENRTAGQVLSDLARRALTQSSGATPQAGHAKTSLHGFRPFTSRGAVVTNALIAQLDVDHVHHARAAAWLDENIAAGWASCPITQNGCVRIMSQPGYPDALPAARVAERPRDAVLTKHHEFIPEDLSLLDVTRFDTEQLLGHRQVTVAYLLGLAR